MFTRASAAVFLPLCGQVRTMATLKDITIWLKSIKNIQKITKSMKMVAAAKYSRAERSLKPARVYGTGALYFLDGKRALLYRTHGQHILVNCKEVGRQPPSFSDGSIIATELLHSGYEFDQGSIIYKQEFLLLHHREHPDGKYHDLVREQHHAGQRALQRVVRSAERIIRTELPDLHSICSKRCWTKARKMVKDLSHPNNGLASCVRSGNQQQGAFVLNAILYQY